VHRVEEATISRFKFRQRGSGLFTSGSSRVERYGAAPVATGRVSPPSTPAFVDPRLRGLDLEGGSGDAYDMTAARYNVITPDPYAAEAQRQRDLGQRMPLPYQFPTALAGTFLAGVSPAESGHYADMHSSAAVNPAGSVSGQRQTQWGTYGASTDTAGGPWFDARKRFGYGQMGSRDTGFSEEWDTSLSRERTAGRLTSVTTFDQEVMRDRPYLHLRAGGTSVQAEGTYDGNALIRVTAGNFEHGGTQIREFMVGGGMVAAFNLEGWDNVRIEVLELMTDTFVEFAWSTQGLHGPNRTLFFPDSYVSSALTSPVPQGAYAIAIEDPGFPVVLVWSSQRGGAVRTFTQTVSGPAASNLYFGQWIPVIGTSFRIDRSVDISWELRPI